MTKSARRVFGFFGLLLALAAVRIIHLGPTIEDPHSWRQCDTAHYTRAFFRDGIDLLAPSVCWMGPRPTVILEFPLPEALTALVQRVLGPRLIWERLVVFAFFLGAALYLYLAVRRLADARLARAATAVFMVLPLGLYYSRALNVDFAAICCGHALLFHLLAGYDDDNVLHLAAGAVLGALGMMIKAPAVFFLLLPLGWHVVSHFDRRRAARSAVFFALPLLAFAPWWSYVERTNSAAPNWSFLPGYRHFAHMGAWYYGTLAQRLDMANWIELLGRIATEVTSWAGVPLAFVGLGCARRTVSRGVFLTWLLGAAIYVLVFFNLNLIHDYYQLPLLGIASVWIGRGIVALADLGQRRGGAWRALPYAAAVVLLANSLVFAEVSYYRPDPVRDAAAEVVRDHTRPGSLVVASMIDTDWCDPRLLYRADRRGWPVKAAYVNGPLLAMLQREGAEDFVLVVPRAAAARAAALVAGMRAERFDLAGVGHVVFIGRLGAAP